MFFLDALVAFFVAILATLLLMPVLGSRRSADERAAAGMGLLVFAIIFLTAWAGGLWLTPFGPAMWDVQWLPFLAMALLAALLIAALTPSPSRWTTPRSPDQDHAEADAAVTAFGAFFWVLIAMLIVAIVAGYWWP